MIEIHFQDARDALKAYKALVRREESLQRESTVYYDKELAVRVPRSLLDNHIEIAVLGLTDFILQNKENYFLTSIIETMFYFTDTEEQQQILEVARSILDGELTDIPYLEDLPSREMLIREALMDLLEAEISFSFESFIKFRLGRYKESLLKYAEMAIEEYKMEQEYQNFIQTLRDLLKDREPRMDILSLLHEEQLLFYCDGLKKMSQEELRSHIDRKILLNNPVYIDSAVLVPLLSISPRKVLVYSDDEDYGMIRTIQNIFQERMSIFPKSQFPGLAKQPSG